MEVGLQLRQGLGMQGMFGDGLAEGLPPLGVVVGHPHRFGHVRGAGDGVVVAGDVEHGGDGGHPAAWLPNLGGRGAVQGELGCGQGTGSQLVF